MPSDRSITASDVEICSQNPTRFPKRNSSTVSAPAGKGGMSREYRVCDPIQPMSACTLS